MKIINPYESGGVWLKGNLHAHTKESPCGHYPLEDVVGIYGDRIMHYDFIAITDHFSLTDTAPVQNSNDLVVFSGVEFKTEALQTLGINITSYEDDADDETNHQQIFNDVTAQGGINVICHPHIYRDDYWPMERLLELEGYTAVEIYNNNVRMNNSGRAVATDVWDKLLSRGRKVWGIASDDLHHYSRCGGGFLQVLAAEKSKRAILDAVKNGAFYASSGIILKNIALIDGKTISLSAASPRVANTTFSFIGKDGRLLKKERPSGPETPVLYTARGDEGYIRVEASREDGAQAWTQPFWME